MEVREMNHSTKKALWLGIQRQTYIFITIVITSCLHFGCASSDEGVQVAASAGPPEVIAEAERLFENRRDLSNLREAVKLLGKARRENQRSYEVEWKFARANYFLGRHSEDEKESTKALEDGKKAAKIAAAMEPDRPDGHFWFGANLGEQSNRNPLAIGIVSVGEIQEAMNKVIAIDPGYQNASAYGALGKIELATRLMGGDLAKAVEYLEKAVELDKNNGDVRLYLAEAFLAQNKDAEARKHLEYVVKIKPHPQYVLEHQQQMTRAKKLLETEF